MTVTSIDGINNFGLILPPCLFQNRFMDMYACMLALVCIASINVCRISNLYFGTFPDKIYLYHKTLIVFFCILVNYGVRG